LILIVANRFDLAARQLAESGSERGAKLLTCEDLSVPGWRYYGGSAPRSTRVMVGGLAVAPAEISGVLTRLTYVWEQELVHIAAEDRGYVAAEMSAFLMAWLSALDCPVLNRPVPGCLAGPFWRSEQWAIAAAAAGMRVRPVHRRVRSGAHDPLETAPSGPAAVTIVGDHCIGEVEDALRVQARRLADIAQVDLIRVYFSGADQDAFFAGADLFPPIAAQDEAAIFNYFTAPGRWGLPRTARNLIPRPSAGICPAPTPG
jgi:hypothetical protein